MAGWTCYKCNKSCSDNTYCNQFGVFGNVGATTDASRLSGLRFCDKCTTDIINSIEGTPAESDTEAPSEEDPEIVKGKRADKQELFDAVMKDVRNGMRQRDIAEKYGIAQSTISRMSRYGRPSSTTGKTKIPGAQKVVVTKYIQGYDICDIAEYCNRSCYNVFSTLKKYCPEDMWREDLTDTIPISSYEDILCIWATIQEDSTQLYTIADKYEVDTRYVQQTIDNFMSDIERDSKTIEDLYRNGGSIRDIAAKMHLHQNVVKAVAIAMIPGELWLDEQSTKHGKRPPDVGKMRALALAGWSLAEIANETKCDVPEVVKLLKKSEELRNGSIRN